MLRHGLAILALTLLLFTGCATTPQSGPLRTPTAAELSRIDDASPRLCGLEGSG
jgi:hypothetical protein